MNNESIQKIINFAFDESIAQSNIDIVQECLSNGAIITRRTLRKYTLDETYNLNKCHWELLPTKKIFKLLLTHGYDTIINDTKFMISCVCHDDSYFMKSIIELGYDSGHRNAAKILLRSIPYGNNTKLLLENGFDCHIKSVMMDCIKEFDSYKLKILIEVGVNIHVFEYDIAQFFYEFTLNKSYYYIGDIKDTINIICDNLRSLNEPITKYLLISQINFDICQDVHLYIMEFYKLLTINNKCVRILEEKLCGLPKSCMEEPD